MFYLLYKTGVLSKKLPGCFPVFCGIPPNYLNSKVMYDGTTYLHNATYTCNEGYAVK